MTRVSFKTIKSFCQMISKRSCFLKSNFLNLFLRLRFLLCAQFVHTKVTFSSDRRYYKRDVMMIHLDFITRFSNLRMLTVIIISCWSRWSYCATCLWELFVIKNSCILENALFLTINRSSSVFLPRNRRCRRRLLELRWDV
jgi:hypothetical protein